MVPLEFLRRLPKCEHHLHIEGTLEPELLFKLANRNKIELPKTFPKTVKELHKKYDFQNLQEFLDLYYVGANVLVTEEDFYELTYAYFKRVSKQTVVHAEIFYDPQTHTSRGVSLETVTKGIERACKQAEKEFEISFKIIMCLLRHTDAKDCSNTIDEAAEYIKDGTIAGLGLDSSEKGFPPKLFEECYAKASKLNPNLKLTAHAGEEGPAAYVTEALDVLKVTRIDHGVRSADDDKLLERLANERVLLTVCPLSNKKLQVVKNLSELPLDKYIENGVAFSINSDDPAYFGGYILENYQQLAKEYPHWGFFTWGQIVKNGIIGSWCDDERKKELIDLTDKVITTFVNRVDNIV